MNKIKSVSNKTKWLGVALAILGFFVASTAVNPPTVGAQSAAEEYCNNKIDGEKCVSEYRKCSDERKKADRDKCIADAKSKYDKKVMEPCRGKTSPSECHEKVEKECKDKNGNDKKKCIEKEAGKFKAALYLGGSKGKYQCGNGADAVKTRINFGCVGNNSDAPIGPIEDMAYAITKFLSYGVGLAIVISIIIAGIQYSTSEGNAETTQAAKSRIQAAVIGLLIYLFAFSILQYLIPGGLFSS